MKDFKTYIKDIDFDRIESYRLNRGKDIICTFKFNKYEITDKDGDFLPNGILDSNNRLNSTAELVTSTDNKAIIEKFRSLFHESSEGSSSAELPLYKNGLLLYRNDEIVKGINVSFRQGLFSDTDNVSLRLSSQDFESFRLFFYQDLKHELFEVANYHGNIGLKWNEYNYPNSFYFNPHWQSYETTIVTPILHRNYNGVRAEVETGGRNISQGQLKRLDYVCYYPIKLKKEMFLKVYDAYNHARRDYDLPEIKGDIENILPFFVRLKHVLIPANDEDDIQLSFSCWDEEHGLYIRIHENGDKMVIE